MTPNQIANRIDHTLLKPDASQIHIERLCDDALTYHFKSVCINPYWVPFCAKRLKSSKVNICTVVGFPLGATDTTVKSNEAKWAVENGADEVDMVINIGALKSHTDDVVLHDIESIKTVCHNTLLKVIIETALLNNEEIKNASLLSKHAGADFVKTSTGFSSAGATIENIKLMRASIGKNMGLKASGGIKTYTDVLNMINAGASRIGTSNGVQIVKDCTLLNEMN